MRLVVRQIMPALLQQSTSSQYPEHPVVPSQEEHHRTGTPSLFT